MLRPEGSVTLEGRELNTARRALAVALISEVTSGGLGAMSGLIPSREEIVRVLDVLDWPGAPDQPVTLARDDRCVLERVVFAALVLALEEGEKAAEAALGATASPADIGLDTSGLIALERLAGLAAWLTGPETARRNDRTGESPDVPSDDAFVSPALQSLASALGLPVWIADPTFRIEWVNSALAAVLGASADSVQGSMWHQWCPPGDHARVRDAAYPAALEQRSFTVEVAIGSSELASTHLLVIAAPRLCPAGQLLGWAGICFPVANNESAWVRAESLARTHTVAAAQTHLLLGQLPGMIWTTDRNLRCTSSQGAGLRALGLAPNQIVGFTFQEFTGVDDPAHPALRAHLAALEGTSSQYRDNLAGRTFQVHVEPLTDPRGNIVGCIGISHDVTEAVLRERQHAQLLRQLELAQSVAQVGSWECDVSTGEWLWSDEAYRLLGVEPGSIEPSFEAFIARVHPEDRDELIARHRHCAERGLGYETPYRLVLPDGNTRQIRGVVRFEHDTDGSLTRIGGILQAIDATPAGEN